MTEPEAGHRKLKVVFLGFALAHYFNDLLCRIQQEGGIEVVLATVCGGNPRLGAGVYETRKNVAFRVLELKEEIRECPWRYPLLELARFQKPTYPSFRELAALLSAERPHIIVVAADHFELFAYDHDVARTVRRLGIRLVFHSIPFWLSTWDMEGARCTRESALCLKSLPRLVRTFATAFPLSHAYSRFVRRRTLLKPIEARRKVFNIADAHACYFEGGIDIYGSYGVPRERIHVVRNSPDTDKLFAARRQLEETERPQRDRFRLIHVGRLVEWKRVDLLLRAIADLRPRFPGINGVVIGTGPQEARLKTLAAELGLTGIVRFTGGLYEPLDLGREMLSAGVYVLAGMGGLSINEAMCFGLPVICSVCDGTETFLVRDGKTGLRFSEGDLPDLTDKIAALLSDPNRAADMGCQATKLIRSEVNIHTVTQGYVSLFRDLTA